MLEVKDIKIGAKLRNNDTRKAGEIVTIEAITRKGAAIDQNWAVYRTARRVVSVRFDRIFFDGRARSQGYNLLAAAEPA